MVTEHAEVDSEGQMELSDEDEEDLCKVWDMAMDKVKYCNVFFIQFSFTEVRVFKDHSALNKLNEL